MTLLHQHQRPSKVVEHAGHRIEFIEVTGHDIEIANKLAAEVLFNEADELPPQTRKLLDTFKSMPIPDDMRARMLAYVGAEGR